MSHAHDYTIRESPRAKRVALRVSRRGDLEVVIPRGLDPDIVPHIVERHEAWIERRLSRAARDRMLMDPEPPDGRPTHIALRALREEILVTYVPRDSSRLTVLHDRSGSIDGTGKLHVVGPVAQPADCRAALRRWLRRQARDFLVPRLDSLAAGHDFEFVRASIRLQRTRWGSCSSSGTISLNAKSLFLPPELVDHLLLHELCHTESGDHSKRFYALLGQHSPEATERERELKQAWRYVPSWADE